MYELTEYGLGLRAVMHQLAHWGARMMHVPTSGDLEPGWLHGALPMAFPPTAPASRVEFRIGDEIASLVDGGVLPHGIEDPDAVVIGDAPGFYHLVVDRDLSAVTVEGDTEVVAALLDALPPCAAEAAVPTADVA